MTTIQLKVSLNHPSSTQRTVVLYLSAWAVEDPKLRNADKSEQFLKCTKWTPCMLYFLWNIRQQNKLHFTSDEAEKSYDGKGRVFKIISFALLTKAPLWSSCIKELVRKTTQKRKVFSWLQMPCCGRLNQLMSCAAAVPPSSFMLGFAKRSRGVTCLKKGVRGGCLFLLLGYNVVGGNKGENHSILDLNHLPSVTFIGLRR